VARFHTQSGNRKRIRVTAWLLLLSLLLPFAQMAYGSTGDAGLMACCHGSRMCPRASAASHAEANKQPSLRAPQVSEKCPCVPASPSSVDNAHAGLPEAQPLTWDTRTNVFLPAAHNSQRSELRTRAHPKRGPPSLLLT